MLSGESARAQKGHGQDIELLAQGDDQHTQRLADRGADEKTSASAAGRNNRDKIRCLDGLRGIACLLVFNYHFLWPWTPNIMMGHGATPPGSLEPYNGWPFLPIICLLHRGRPMVAIFFAISGYVLVRHILRAIHERRLETAYKSLASSVFRRVFRLYIPPTISMFLVAMLAQMGAFREEDDIFKGPDSAYINGTSTQVHLGKPCKTNTTLVHGVDGMADYLGVSDLTYLTNITGWGQKPLCLNATSESYGPVNVYSLLGDATDAMGQFSNKTDKVETWGMKTYIDDQREDLLKTYYGPIPTPKASGSNYTNCSDYLFVQFGGSWEEHPFIHDNMTFALQNFTRAYAEWVNPFNFGHYHPRYDPHTFTIPMELRGSMFIYLFLLGTAALKARWRLSIAGVLVAYSLHMSRWDMATFLGGTTMSELDIRSESQNERFLVPPATSSGRGRSGSMGPKKGERRAAALRWVGFVVALYFLSYPDAGAEWTPGFKFLSSWVPKYYAPISGWMFYQSMGALMLVYCIMRSPFLVGLLEGKVAQYLGRVSFSFYLIHGPVLHSLGFWIMPRLFDRFGKAGGYIIGWPVLLGTSLYLSNWWYKKVDLWSATVGKKIEKALVE